LNEGAISVMEWNHSKAENGYYWQQLETVAKEYDIDMGKPFSELSEDQRNIILFGSGGKSLKMELVGRNDRISSYQAPFEGVIPNLKRRFDETNSDFIRDKIAEYMVDNPCHVCN